MAVIAVVALVYHILEAASVVALYERDTASVSATVVGLLYCNKLTMVEVDIMRKTNVEIIVGVRWLPYRTQKRAMTGHYYCNCGVSYEPCRASRYCWVE